MSQFEMLSAEVEILGGYATIKATGTAKDVATFIKELGIGTSNRVETIDADILGNAVANISVSVDSLLKKPRKRREKG